MRAKQGGVIMKNDQLRASLVLFLPSCLFLVTTPVASVRYKVPTLAHFFYCADLFAVSDTKNTQNVDFEKQCTTVHLRAFKAQLLSPASGGKSCVLNGRSCTVLLKFKYVVCRVSCKEW